MFAVWMIFLILLANKAITFGSKPGNWDYGYASDISIALIFRAASWAVALTVLYWLSDLLIDRARWAVLSTWIVTAATFQWYSRSLYDVSVARIVESDGCTSFFSAAQRHSVYALLSRFEEIAPSLPDHARTNMPGKTILFRMLQWLSPHPDKVGLLIIILAALAGPLIYALAERWFRSRRAGLLAMVLYQILPAKVNFVPIPNVLAPIPIFAALWLLLLSLQSKKPWLLCLVGVLLYVVLVFEPLPFTLGFFFVAAIAQSYLDGRLSFRSASMVGVLTALGFVTVHAFMRLFVHFDAIHVLRLALEDAVDFNQREKRPYDIWIVHNLIEFAFGIGIVPAFVLLSGTYRTAEALTLRSGWRSALASVFRNPVANFLVVLGGTLMIVDLMGVNRGEITRLWILLAVAAEIGVAGYCIAELDRSSARLLVASCTMQAMLTTVMVRFLFC